MAKKLPAVRDILAGVLGSFLVDISEQSDGAAYAELQSHGDVEYHGIIDTEQLADSIEWHLQKKGMDYSRFDLYSPIPVWYREIMMQDEINEAKAKIAEIRSRLELFGDEEISAKLLLSILDR